MTQTKTIPDGYLEDAQARLMTMLSAPCKSNHPIICKELYP